MGVRIPPLAPFVPPASGLRRSGAVGRWRAAGGGVGCGAGGRGCAGEIAVSRGGPACQDRCRSDFVAGAGAVTEFRVFLSAVSSEFRNARNALTDDFGTRDVLV